MEGMVHYLIFNQTIFIHSKAPHTAGPKAQKCPKTVKLTLTELAVNLLKINEMNIVFFDVIT